MKKIVRRNHIRENFRANLQERITAGDVADIFIPGVSAFKNFKKGDIAGGLIDAGLDVASLVAGGLTGGLGYGAARGVISAAKAGRKVSSATRIARKSRSVPNTGYGPWGKFKKGKLKTPEAGAAAGGAAAGAVGGAAGGAASGGRGSSIPDTPKIYGKERPQTGFRDRYQGIDPFRSGEMRASAGYYDTPVGRRQLYKGAGGGLVAPPSTMYENTVFPQLQEMVNKSIKAKEINNILVTQDMAKNIVELHEALNTKNKRILEESVQSKDGFFEVLDFSVRN